MEAHRPKDEAQCLAASPENNILNTPPEQGAPLRLKSRKTSSQPRTVPRITLREKNRAIQESQVRLAEAQRVAQIGSWEYDLIGGKITWSNELFRQFEMNPAEGAPSVEALMARYHPDDVAMHISVSTQAMQDGLPYEFDIRALRRDGSVRWTHAVGQGERDAAGRVVRLFGTLKDIHERKMVEADKQEHAERLHQDELILRTVLESAPLILYAADADGTVTLSEGKGLAALGLKPGELVGHSVFEFSGGESEGMAGTQRALAGEAVSYDALALGLCLHFEIRPVRNVAGILTGIIGVCLDATERMRAAGRAQDYTLTLEVQNGELEKVNAKLATLAIIDGLTSLHNHRAFQERLAEEANRAARYGTPLSLILLDVDRFKDFNDTYGHPAGDAVLRSVAQVLQGCARDTDLAARYGGEEFAIILPETDRDGASAFAERVRRAVERHPWPLRSVTASFGVASLRLGEESGAEMLCRADGALYRAKASGRNRVVCAAGPDSAAGTVPDDLSQSIIPSA